MEYNGERMMEFIWRMLGFCVRLNIYQYFDDQKQAELKKEFE